MHRQVQVQEQELCHLRLYRQASLWRVRKVVHLVDSKKYVPWIAVGTALAQMAPASVRQVGRVKLARIRSVRMIVMVVAPVQPLRQIILDRARATRAGLVMHVSFRP